MRLTFALEQSERSVENAIKLICKRL